MGIARTTVGINRFFEDFASGKPGRRAFANFLIVAAGIQLVLMGLLLAFGADMKWAGVAGGGFIGLTLLFLMLVRHEYLYLLGFIAGHTIFYGRFPNQLGMRVLNAVGPAEFLFFLAFVAGLIYWYGHKDRPSVPFSLWIPALILFLYAAGYTLVGYFFYERTDNALEQATGWMYFTLALPTFLCLTTGRSWKAFFVVIFGALMIGALFSMMLEVGVGESLINRTGYGGLGFRTWGDLSVKTNMLGTTVVGTLLAIIVAAFAKRTVWKTAGVAATLAGLVIIFLDRGRIHYAGLGAAIVFLLFFLPTLNRWRVLYYGALSVILGVVIIVFVGGNLEDKAVSALEKAQERIELAQGKAVQVDPGLTLRYYRNREAEAIFLQNPLIGGGPGIRFGYEFDWTILQNVPITQLDNSFLYPLAVGGLIGLGLILFTYTAMIIVTVRAMIRLRNPLHKALAFVPLGSFMFMAICSWVTWWLVDRFHVAAFAVMVGVAVALVRHEEVHGSETPVVNF